MDCKSSRWTSYFPDSSGPEGSRQGSLWPGRAGKKRRPRGQAHKIIWPKRPDKGTKGPGSNSIWSPGDGIPNSGRIVGSLSHAKSSETQQPRCAKGTRRSISSHGTKTRRRSSSSRMPGSTKAPTSVRPGVPSCSTGSVRSPIGMGPRRLTVMHKHPPPVQLICSGRHTKPVNDPCHDLPEYPRLHLAQRRGIPRLNGGNLGGPD